MLNMETFVLCCFQHQKHRLKVFFIALQQIATYKVDIMHTNLTNVTTQLLKFTPPSQVALLQFD